MWIPNAEGSGSLGCGAVALDCLFWKFRKTVMPPSSGIEEQKRNYEPNDTTSHPRRLESSTTLLWEPYISNLLIKPHQLSLSWATVIQSTISHPFTLTPISILFSQLRAGLPRSPLPSGSAPKSCLHFCVFRFLPLAPPVSSHLVWSPRQCLLRSSTSHEARQSKANLGNCSGSVWFVLWTCWGQRNCRKKVQKAGGRTVYRRLEHYELLHGALERRGFCWVF